MSERPYNPEPNPERYQSNNQPNVFRDDQMYVEVHSSDLARRGVLKYLTDSTPSHMPPVGKYKDIPIVVVLGDTASMDDDTLAKSREFYLDGVLRAAATSESLVVDSGLASTIGVCKANLEHSDFCRNTYQMGIVPSRVKEPLSLYHTQMIAMTDFNGWNDRPAEFANEKFNFIRRLAGHGRIICVLFNEGHVAFEEVYAAAQAGIAIIAVKGSGGLADELAEAQAVGSSSNPKVTEMINMSCVASFDMSNGRICDFAALIRMYSTVDVVSMQRQISKLDYLDIDPVYFQRGAPIYQLRVREGIEGRLKFINSGKTAGTNGQTNGTKKRKNNNAKKSRTPTTQKTEKQKKTKLKPKSKPAKQEPTVPIYKEEHHEAVTKIAAAQRGKVSRVDTDAEKKKRGDAAVLIQKTYRGRQGVQRAERKKQGKPLEAEVPKNKFKQVKVDYDPPLVSKYRKDGFWVEIMHVAHAVAESKLYMRIRAHGIGTWLDLPKVTTLKQGKKQNKMKMLALRKITKQKAVHVETGEDKVTIEAVIVYIVKPNEKRLSELSFMFQAGYKPVSIPNSFLRDYDMFQSAGPLKKVKKNQPDLGDGASRPSSAGSTKSTSSNSKETKKDDKSGEEKKTKEEPKKDDEKKEETPEEIAAAIKLEAAKRESHDKEVKDKMKKDKEELLKNEPKMTEEKAAIKLEAMARGNRDREKVRRMKKDLELAKKSGMSEEETKKHIEEHQKGKMTEEEAAIKIEAIQRGKYGCRNVFLLGNNGQD